MFKSISDKDFLAKTVPIVINIDKNVFDRLIIKDKNQYDKKLIFEYINDNMKEWDNEYNGDNLKVSCPKTENSYTKHITNVVKLSDAGVKSIIDAKWKTTDKEFYYKKCWWIFIDDKKNRLVVVRWNGLKLCKT